MIQFSFARSEDGTETIVLMGSQGVRVVPDNHANYAKIKDALMSGEGENEVHTYGLADAAATVNATLHKLSERVMLKSDEIYFDGDLMETRLTRHIVDMVRNGDDNYGGYVHFLENVQANPSKASRKALFKFLDKHDLLITPDGYFIGYKGIASDGKSLSSGTEDVTVTLPDDTVEVHRGRIPNPVGATVSMSRDLVDPDRETACSVGLHVGTHSYANNFSSGGNFLTVKVNPRDVVSVPSDSNDQKIRTCRYTILEENINRTRYEGTSFGVDETEGPDDSDYGDGCACEYDEYIDDFGL